MEQTVAERPFSNEQQTDNGQTSNIGSLGSDTHFGQDPCKRWYTRRQTDCSSSQGDNVIHDKAVCRDFIRGNCARGTSCRFRHCESDSEDGHKLYVCYDFQRGQCNRVSCKFLHPESDKSNGCGSNGKELDAVANAGRSQVCGEKMENDSRISYFSREPRSRSPCSKFLNGMCYHGDACPHLHSEYPTHDRLRSGRSTQWQQGITTTSRNASLGEANIGNTRWTSREHVVREGYNDVNTRFFSRERRSRSPCRNFLRGRCHRGAYCPRLHLDMHIRPRDDCDTQQNQVVEATSGHLSKGSVDIPSWTSAVHEEVIEGQDRSTRSFTAGFRSKSPCRNFLRGRCHHGAYCPHLHLDTYVRPRDDCNALQHHEVATTSDNPGLGEGSAEIALKTSQELDEINDVDSRSRYFPRGPRSGSPCRKFLYGRCYRGASCFYLHPGYQTTYDRSGNYVDDIAGCWQNRSQPVGESMHRGSDGDNMVVNSRSWASERQRSRPLEDLVDKARPEVCLKYCRGRCTQGESCRYLHSFHEYAKSASDCIKPRHFESATPPANRGGTRPCETSMMRQERDGLFDGRTTGQYADNTEKCNIQFRRDEIAAVDHQKYENNGDGIGRNCEYSVAGYATSPKCGPSKGQRSRSGSPFTNRDEFSGRKVRREEFQNNFHRGRCSSRSPVTPKDDSGWRERRRYESHDNFPRGRGYSVAPFRYPYSRSYRYNGPRYFMNNEPHSRVAATSVGPSSHAVNRDSNVLETQGGDEVASHDMQLGHCSSSCLNTLEDAEQPSCVDEDRGGSVGDCGELAISKGEIAVSSSIAGSDSTKQGENHGPPMDTTLCVSNKEDNADVIADLSQDGIDKLDGKKQALKTYKRKVTDSSTQGLPSSSTRGSSLCQPDTVLMARVSDDSDAQELMMVSHSVQEPGKRKGVVKEIQNTIESAQTSTKDGASVGGQSENNCMQTFQSSIKASTSSLRRKLLVLDVNGLLADIVTVSDVPRGYKPDTIVAMKAVFKRPFCDDFLDFCFERFDVGIWSSRTKKNVDRVVDFLMFNTKQRLLFCWDQAHCTETGYKTIENRDKPLVLKELKKLWEKQEADLPWDKGFYNETNTVLLDDSPYKALRNPPYTAIFPHGYKFRDVKDRSLGPGGDLRVYLERLAVAEDVQKFIQENPFGQRPITKSNLSWGFYSKIAGSHFNYQGSTSCTPMEISADNASRQGQTANNNPSKNAGGQANPQKREADNASVAKSAGDHAELREGNVDKIPAIQVGCFHSNQRGNAGNNPVSEKFGTRATQLGGSADKTPATRVLGAHVNLQDGDIDTIPVTESVAPHANQQEGSTDNTAVAKVVGNSSQQEGDADDSHATINPEANANHQKEKVKNTPEAKIVRVDTDQQVVGNANTAATTVEANGSPRHGNGVETPATP